MSGDIVDARAAGGHGTPRARPWFDLSALAHPVWWASLALLIVNDNLLKGRGILPGWLTGKLSDFAFLVVAPVLLAALLPRRLRARRTLALVSVVGLYVAAELSPTVSDAVVATAARLGVVWRLWPDPTDLLALAILPVTFWLLRARAIPAGAVRDGRARAGVIVGAAACLATSAPHMFPYAPFLINRTASAADVRITWVLAQVDCATSPAALAATLNPSDLDDPRQLSLVRGQVAALDGPAPAGTSSVGRCTTLLTQAPRCVAAILEAPAARPTLMIAQSQWSVPGDEPSRCQPALDPAFDPGSEAVSLALVDGESRFVVSDTGPQAKIKLVAIDPAAVATRPAAADGCRAARDVYRALLGATTCQSNADCRAVHALALPGEPPTGEPALCLSLNTAAATEVEGLARTWNDRCLSDSSSCQGALPVACVAGACAPVCRGREVPFCPPSCRHYPMVDFSEGKPCDTNIQCFADDGRRCHCEAALGASTGVVACAPDTPIGLDCPIACLDSSASYRDDAGPTVVDGGTD